mmetsp:Transcript_51477/g.154549  ORF Transcript_51477/g.154549 Transcript_51477/m.154549 type:complete len:137 (-) Transcript_51477:166-576(-)
MSRAAARTAPASRLIEGIDAGEDGRLLRGLVTTPTTPMGAVPPETTPIPGSGAWYWSRMRSAGYSDGEVVGITIGFVAGFFVSLCIIFIFLGSIQYYSRKKAMEAKQLASVGGEGGEGTTSAAASNIRDESSSKDK